MKRNRLLGLVAVSTLAMATSASLAEVVIQYDIDAGGNNPDDPGGLAAQATFAIDGTSMTILLENISDDAPDSAEAADSLLVSIAFNLNDGVSIVNGVSAVIGEGSVGLGAWDGLVAGDSVAEQWAWTNTGGGDQLIDFDQVISTSSGFGGGYTGFDGSNNPSINGPFGGIAADPPTIPLPQSKEAVSNSILFTLELSAAISEEDLGIIAGGSMVEFGSDFQYLVPAPGAMALLGLGAIAGRRRRRN